MSQAQGSSRSSSGLSYEVFLNFRGPDTRDGFCDYLYISLSNAEIFVFRDDDELRVGEEIGPELLRALNQSKIYIPIFSKGYASSKWCLMELAQMFRSVRAGGGQKIFPIFYYVTPGEVKHQTGSYADAFSLHEKERDDETVQEWRSALKAAGALKGWEIVQTTNRKEGKLVDLVVKKVLRILKKDYLTVTDHLVGLDKHKEAIMDVVRESASQTYIGICGMGGVGKTTLAKAIYNQLSSSFEACCFLANVRETTRVRGVEALQDQLISSLMQRKVQKVSSVDEGIVIIKSRFSGKKVLILVDDADQKSQLRALVDRHSWFGLGSLIIITTRSKDILGALEMDFTYEMSCLNLSQSLELFCKHAFRRDYPPDGYVALSKSIVRTTGSLPLALEVIGSRLYGENKQMWESTLRRLRDIPRQEVRNKLRISYDSLENDQQQIFLDIACFFIGYDKDIATYMWEDCNYHPGETLEVLEVMSLIEITKDNTMWMHDQLRDLGRSIVSEESQIIEHRSRLWNSSGLVDIISKGKVNITLFSKLDHFERLKMVTVISSPQGGDRVEAINLNYHDDIRQILSSHDQLAKLPSVRFLQLDSSYNDPSSSSSSSRPQHKLSLPPADYFQKLTGILPKLRWLSCHGLCPLVFLLVKFSFENMAILDISRSPISGKWLGWRQIQMAKKLKVLNLTKCKNLTVTPDFSDFVLLERLILSKCKSLVEIHPSIGKLKNLILLNLAHCKELRRLPEEIADLGNLRQLLLAESGVLKFPDWRFEWASNSIQSLTKLDLRGAQIVELCRFVGVLKSLEVLRLTHCKSLTRLPDEIGELTLLTNLNVSHSGIVELPRSIGSLNNLKILKTCFTSIKKLPLTIRKLTSLEELDCSSTPLEGKIPLGIKRLVSLKKLRCTKTSISSVPHLPSNLTTLDFSSTCLQEIPDLSGLSNLKLLDLDINAKEPELLDTPVPSWIRTLQKLETLTLSMPHIITLSPDIGDLPLLKRLVLSNCKNLRDIPRLPSCIKALDIRECPSLKSMPDLANLKSMATLNMERCSVEEVRGIEGLESLTDLTISSCQGLQRIPDLSSLSKLKVMITMNCPKLVRIQGRTESLQTLLVMYCPSLVRLPDLRDSRGLKNLAVYMSPRVRDIEQFAELKTVVNVHFPPSKRNEFDGKVIHLTNAYSLKTGVATHNVFILD